MRLTKHQRQAARDMFRGLCAYCGQPLGDSWHADHHEPLRRDQGGIEGRDVPENIMPACAPCNISKSSYSLEQWRGVLVGYIGALERNHPTYRRAKAFGLIRETMAPVRFHFEIIVQRRQWTCGVSNCGGGKCVHEVTNEDCPHCGYPLIRATTTGHLFCSNHQAICEYERAA